MSPRRFHIAAAIVLSLAIGGVARANGTDYPSRPIRLIVPLAAGSTADILSRVVGAELAHELGQPVIVENRPGAGGTIAMADVAHSAPDGLTIAFASQGTLVFSQSLYATPGYDSLKDFAPIVLAGGVSNVMIVPPNSPAKSVMDVVAAAKSHPGKLTYASGGVGTSHHLSGVLFGDMTGTKLLHVSYKGAPQGVLAVMSGEVDMGFFNTPTVISQIQHGKVKALAVTSLERSALLPQLPTMDESGVKGYEVNTWFGFVAPAGTPPQIVMTLHDTIGKILSMPETRHKLAVQGFDIAPLKPSAAFAALIRDDMAKWTPIIKRATLKPE